MTSEEALISFLRGALEDRWKRRYLSLIHTKHGKKDFLFDLHHNLENRFDNSKIVKEIPADIWSTSAFSFNYFTGFGRLEKSMKEASEIVGDSSLIVDASGKYGIYKPEEMIDKIKMFKA